MKTMILFIILSLALISCKKTDDYQSINIITDFKDDVSPVLVELSIGGEYDHLDWTFEEKYSPSENSPNPAFHIFMTKGQKSVKVQAFNNKTGEKFSGFKQLTIPDVARKLKITGFFFKNISGNNPYSQKPITISINHYKNKMANISNISLAPAVYQATDSIFFQTPISLEIGGFLNDQQDANIVFINIGTNQENNLSINSNFYLKTNYLEVRPWTPDHIQLSNTKNNSITEIFLLTDWTLD